MGVRLGSVEVLHERIPVWVLLRLNDLDVQGEGDFFGHDDTHGFYCAVENQVIRLARNFACEIKGQASHLTCDGSRGDGSRGAHDGSVQDELILPIPYFQAPADRHLVSAHAKGGALEEDVGKLSGIEEILGGEVLVPEAVPGAYALRGDAGLRRAFGEVLFVQIQIRFELFKATANRMDQHVLHGEF